MEMVYYAKQNNGLEQRKFPNICKFWKIVLFNESKFYFIKTMFISLRGLLELLHSSFPRGVRNSFPRIGSNMS
jgi:hypothetical protein